MYGLCLPLLLSSSRCLFVLFSQLFKNEKKSSSAQRLFKNRPWAGAGPRVDFAGPLMEPGAGKAAFHH